MDTTFSPTASTPHPQLLRYLRRATALVPAARRQELWDELEDHLVTRSRHLQALGLDPDEALRRALAELGGAAHITLGMGRVFHATRAALLLGALGLAGAVWAVGGGARSGVVALPLLDAPVMFASAAQRCYQGHNPALNRSMSTPVSTGCRWLLDRVEDAPPINLDTASRLLASQGVSLRPEGRSSWQVQGEGRQAAVKVRYVYQGDRYAAGSGLARALLTLHPGARLSHGEAGPTLHGGPLNVAFGQRRANPGDLSFYRDLRADLLGRLGVASEVTVDPAVDSDVLYRLKTPLPAGEVVMLFSRLPGNVYVTDFAQVKAGGDVSLRAAQSRLRFVKSAADLRATPISGQAPALLVRVTGTPLNALSGAAFLPIH